MSADEWKPTDELTESTAHELAAAFEGMFFPGWDHINEFDRKLYRRYAARILARFGPELYEQGHQAGVQAGLEQETTAAAERDRIARRPEQGISYANGISPLAQMAAVDRAIIPTPIRKGRTA